jgi:hypothetical protein
MANEHEPTRGRVLSFAPAYDTGSEIYNGNGTQALPADPLDIVRAHATTAERPLFVPTRLPSLACADNPLTAQPLSWVPGITAGAFDGFLHYGRLTPANRPTSTTIEHTTNPTQMHRIRAALDRVSAAETALGTPR